MRGIAPNLAVLLLTVALAGVARAESPPTTAPASAAVVVLHGEINEFSRDHFMRGMEAAQARGVGTIIIDIDTYGGLVKSALEMSEYIRGLTVHTIAYVNPKAYSAGAMISMACDEIVMAPSATIGDCAPIAVDHAGYIQSLGPTERGKFESPIVNNFDESVFHRYPIREPDTLAQRRQQLRIMAAAMVVMDREVYWVEKDGQRRIVDGEEYKKLSGQGWRPVGSARNPIDSASSLLTVGTTLAVQLGIASGSAASVGELAEQRHLQIVATFTPAWGDALIGLLNSPYARGLLLVIFLICLYTALHTPGQGMPEAGAAVSLAVLLGVPLLTGYAQWWEIVMIMIGLSLVAVEIFVLPGHIVPGLVGVLLVLGGIVMTFVGREPSSPGFWPQLPGTWVSLRTGVLVVVIGMASSLALMAWLRQYLPKLPYFSRLILASPGAPAVLANGAGASAAVDRPILWPPVGWLGRTVSELRPGGSAEFPADGTGRETRVIPVISDSGYIPRGATVAVQEIVDNQVIVREANAA